MFTQHIAESGPMGRFVKMHSPLSNIVCALACALSSFSDPDLFSSAFFGTMMAHVIHGHPDAPQFGFVIRSDGSVLVGAPNTYTMEDVRNWWQQWYAWRSSGIFDNVPAPETSSSSTAPYVPDAKSNNDEKDDKGSKEETPKTNEKSKKQNKKKKGKR